MRRAGYQPPLTIPVLPKPPTPPPLRVVQHGYTVGHVDLDPGHASAARAQLDQELYGIEPADREMHGLDPVEPPWWGFGDMPSQYWTEEEWSDWAGKVMVGEILDQVREAHSKGAPLQSTKVSTVEVVIGWSVSAIILLVVLIGIYVNAL